MKKVTIMDIANKVGVSKATVSMVLNKKDSSISQITKDRILNTAKELGYIPNSLARSLSTRKTCTIGAILPDIVNPFFAQVARAIEDSAQELGYNVIFCNSDSDIEKEEKYIKLLISKLVDGVIFAAGGKSDKNLSYLRNNNVPFVLVDRYIEGYEDAYGVYCNNKEGVMEGIKYLYNKGNRKIAFVMGPDKIQVSLQRLSGYKEAMQSYNLYNEDWVYQTKLTLEGGMKATEELINKLENIDAILYSNDMMALGGIKYLTRKGYKVPENIRVMGFDNITFSEFTEPELTTISQPIYEMGRESCKLLIDVINNEAKQEQIYFKPEIIIRGTA
ncbi:LacI family DNA-binding transcriptional regulator [Clostridium polynesiense]|uniref:LacI family DNA-binding transcriptional regulator n=1 Tax=Clostridium polynesiense TaxID=1325933 RepID=UPI0005917410|nr:LacI family DNA-binding transcriptional regulator [Clostridium polynesiense]